ncbi:MAG: DUF2079 domain-containing protein [Ruminococcaceae bacterium]|nr:DUF2079 domain-containing protein [Oscillospiraceae bacterium]
MRENVKKIIYELGKIFTAEKLVCRLIASWFALTFIRSFEGDHFDLTFGQSATLGYIALLALLFFAVFSIVDYFFADFEVDPLFLLIFSTLCFIKWLIDIDVQYVDAFLYSMAVIAVYLIIVFYVFHKEKSLISKIRIGNKTVLILAAIFGTAAAVVISVIGCLRVFTYSAPNFDFGLFVNMFHNMRESGLPMSTSERDVLLSHFAVHISPIYYLILPFYYIIPSPNTLQIAQAVILVSGVIPLILICRSYKLSNKSSIVLAFIYCLYPAMSGGCFYDIHENCFLLPLLLWVFCFFEREKWVFVYIFSFLTLMVKEDAAIYIMVFALFVIMSRKKHIHGFILLIASAAYFFLALHLLDKMGEYYAAYYADATPNPAIKGAMVNRFDNLILEEDDGIIGVIKTVIKNPGYVFTQLFETSDSTYFKLRYIVQMLLPLGFIPFVTKKVSRYILILPILINLLTDYVYQYNIGFQYHFGITAFLFYLTVMNLSEMRRPSRQTMLIIGAVSCCCLYITLVAPMISRYSDMYSENKDSYKSMSKVLEEIPEEASVSCSTMLAARLSDRDEIYQIEYHGNETDVDYVVFDKRYKVDYNIVYAYKKEGYSVIKETNELMIMEKGRNDN